jgi:hypothetical protein
VTAPPLRKATDEALRAASALPAKPTRLQLLPLDDWEAEQKAPQPRDLIGSAEAALLLGVSRQRVGQLAQRADFPSCLPLRYWFAARRFPNAPQEGSHGGPTGVPPRGANKRTCRIRLICHTSAWGVDRVGGHRYGPAQSLHASGCGEAA